EAVAVGVAGAGEEELPGEGPERVGGEPARGPRVDDAARVVGETVAVDVARVDAGLERRLRLEREPAPGAEVAAPIDHGVGPAIAVDVAAAGHRARVRRRASAAGVLAGQRQRRLARD